MDKKEFALEVISRLKEAFPDSGCSLVYDEPYKLLISVRLAAQCFDSRVNQITPLIYAKFPDLISLSKADPAEIEEIIKPCGFGHIKARDISKCAKKLVEDFDGVVPSDMDKLLSLPGVGRKSANLIRGDIFGLPAIVTDTHCIRIVNRIGLVNKVTEPEKVEKELEKLIPKEEGNLFCHRLVDLGRTICVARKKPDCNRCCLNDVCLKRGLKK